jgi:hypothetical protein
MSSKYTYNISTALPNNMVNTASLITEINSSVITIALDYIETADGYCNVWFKAALSGPEELTLEGLLAAHSGVPAPHAPEEMTIIGPKTSDGVLRVAAEKTDASRITLFSHNWCDKTTWYTGSARVVSETLQDAGDHCRHNFAHSSIIDTYHGKISQEDYIKDNDGYSYRVSVKVDGATKSEQDPHFASGGDFIVNYADGYLTFLTPLSGTEVVTATYHYAQTGDFIIAPKPSKVLSIIATEVQFGTDVTLCDTTLFQGYGYVDVFAPQLMPAIPSGTKIPLGDPVTYKTICDFMNDATKAYPQYAPLSSSNWRGLNVPVCVMNWDYAAGMKLYSSAGMEIRVSLQHNTPHQGTFATATFYCTSEPGV